MTTSHLPLLYIEEVRVYESTIMIYEKLFAPSYFVKKTVSLYRRFTEKRYTASRLSSHMAAILQNVGTYLIYVIVTAYLVPGYGESSLGRIFYLCEQLIRDHGHTQSRFAGWLKSRGGRRFIYTKCGWQLSTGSC